VNWILLIMTLVVLLFLSLVILELGTRWWLRRRNHYYAWIPYLRLEYHPDPEMFPELERRVRFEINGDGERGNEPPSSLNGLYRILVAGGSPAECGLLDQPTSWPGALERILGEPEHLHMLGASMVHVGNIGRSGIASAHLNLIFQKVLPRYRHLSTIIVMVGGNDVWDWLQIGAPAGYTRSPFPITEACLVRPDPDRPFSWKPKASALSELLREIRRRLLHSIKVRYHVGRWTGKARAMRAHATEIRDSVPDPEGMLSNFERNLRELLITAKAHADRVLVVEQPWFEKNHYIPEELSHFWHGGMGGDPTKREEVSVFYSLEVLSKLMRLMNLRAAQVADNLGVEHLDLMPLLEISLKTFYDFVHFTPAGAAVVAEAIANTLLQPHSQKTVGFHDLRNYDQ
jgi:lysophospholipase L1-like esterase